MFIPTESLTKISGQKRVRESNGTQTNMQRVTNEVQKIITSREKEPLRFYSELRVSTQFQDGESWALHIVKVLLDTLSFPGSETGRYGTPENDIIRKLSTDIPREKVWIKILGIKLSVLEESLKNSELPENHRRRVSETIARIATFYSSDWKNATIIRH